MIPGVGEGEILQTAVGLMMGSEEAAVEVGAVVGWI